MNQAPLTSSAASAPPARLAPLKFLFPGWYAIVMGLGGLSLAWHRAAPLMGGMADGISLIVGAAAGLVFVLLLLATVLRWRLFPAAWAEDRRHPVRHTFIATLPIAAMLMGTVITALFGPLPLGEALWWAGALSQLFVTTWVLQRWWRPGSGHLPWASVTPALLIPIVGNVLAPLGGVPLGHADWAAAQFGIGLVFWPVVLVLLVVRIAVQGMPPERMLPTFYILVAPPTVIGLSALQLGAPELIGWICWGAAAFTLVSVGSTARRLRDLPFAMPHWGLSFPLAAFAAFTLRLAGSNRPLTVLGMALLALASLVILGLLAGTLRGLRDGTLLAPEPVAPVVAAPNP